MKLIDILVRDLSEWPGEDPAITQDSDSFVVSVRADEYDELHYMNGDDGWSGMGGKFMEKFEILAEDHKTAVVTKQEWEQAKGL